jgi:hypothetical protein
MAFATGKIDEMGSLEKTNREVPLSAGYKIARKSKSHLGASPLIFANWAC